jgi:two-component system, OmpR family, response regulator
MSALDNLARDDDAYIDRVAAAVVRKLSEQYLFVPHGDAVLSFGTLTLDPKRRLALVKNREIRLQPKEFGVLYQLARFRPRLLSRDELLELLESPFDIDRRAIDVQVTRLRMKLRNAGADVGIRTVRGAGYRLEQQPA